jgi:hypothetical protein
MRSFAPTPTLAFATIIGLALSLACAGGGSEPAAAPSQSPASTAQNPPEAAPAPVASPAPASAGRPLYYDRTLTPADLEGRTLRELALMRNTIFARVGHPFVKPWLDSYFRAQPWYSPQAKGDLSKLTAYDQENVKLISGAEQAITRGDLVARRDAIRARGATTPEDVIELSLIGAALGEYSGDATVPVASRNPLEDPTVLDGQLTLAHIEGMSPRDLRLLRNTVYARRGREFNSALLRLYFEDKAWYAPRADFHEGMLSAVDKRNIQLIQSMEDRLGGPLRDWDHMRQEGWFEGA